MRSRWIIGCMTGTSLDGLDAALASVRGGGLDMQVTHEGMISRPLPTRLNRVLKHLASGRPAKPISYMRAARDLGACYAQVIKDLQDDRLHVQLDLIVAHGQTIWHQPEEHLSWQLLNPTIIAHQLGVPVLFDLRQADLAADGQGAPITPLSDWVLYRQPNRDRLIVNLGGICNITELPPGVSPDQVGGRDIGPCNLLIDGVVRKLYPHLTYDADGHLAAQGRPDPTLYDAIHQHPFFSRQGVRSTGREEFSDQWITGIVEQASHISNQDMIASAVDAVARDVASCCRRGYATTEVVLAGGGSRNRILIEQIRHHCADACTVLLSDGLGIPATAREALGLAVLGALCQDGVPITLPQVTGAKHRPGAGVWVYP